MLSLVVALLVHQTLLNTSSDAVMTDAAHNEPCACLRRCCVKFSGTATSSVESGWLRGWGGGGGASSSARKSSEHNRDVDQNQIGFF